MAGDRVVINTLERALSGDVNDLQAIQSRVLAEVLSVLGAQRAVMASGGIIDTIPQSFTMGFDCRGGGANILVGAGILAQLSFTWPAAPAPLEAAQRIGITRSTTAVPIPATPNTFMILEARVVDVVTLSTNRDIFDVPTQTFIPTLVNKRVERQVEFQIIQGAGLALPVFSGDPWVPICGFLTDGAGQVPSLPTSFAWDFRNDLKDVLGDMPARSVTITDNPETTVESWAIHTRARGGAQVIGGNYRARNWWGRAWLKEDQGFIPAPDNVVTGAANTAEHIYLCPLIANGVIAWPIAMGTSTGTSKGILTRSIVAPSVEGPDNSGVITWGAGSAYVGFDPVPVKRAAFVGTVYNDNGSNYVPMTQTSGGRALLRPDRTIPTIPLVRVVSRASGVLAAPETHALALAGNIPPCARSVTVRILFGTNGAGATTFSWEFRRNGEVLSFGEVGAMTDDAGARQQDSLELELPVHESSADGLQAAMAWDLVLTPLVGNTDIQFVSADVMGWSF